MSTYKLVEESNYVITRTLPLKPTYVFLEYRQIDQGSRFRQSL